MLKFHDPQNIYCPKMLLLGFPKDCHTIAEKKTVLMKSNKTFLYKYVLHQDFSIT